MHCIHVQLLLFTRGRIVSQDFNSYVGIAHWHNTSLLQRRVPISTCI